MRQRVKEIEKEPADAGRCHHFWIIEIANGPKSHGECKYCGETKDFYNSIVDLNDPRRKNNPLNLPKMSRVKLDKGSKS
jgi:hypothetical protein